MRALPNLCEVQSSNCKPLLYRLLSGRKLKPFKPQSRHLSLITTGNEYAVATRGFFCVEVSSCQLTAYHPNSLWAGSA